MQQINGQDSSLYVTRVELEEKMEEIDQKFEDLTNIMLREFDSIYVRFDSLEEKFDRRFDDQEKGFNLRFSRLDNNIQVIMRHLGIPEGQTAL